MSCRARNDTTCLALLGVVALITDWKSANFTEEDTDDLRDGDETTESSHRRTDEEKSDVLEESEVLSDVDEILAATTHSLRHGKSRYRHVRTWIGVLPNIDNRADMAVTTNIERNQFDRIQVRRLG